MKVSIISDDNVLPDKTLKVNRVDREYDCDTLHEFVTVALRHHISPAVFNYSPFNPQWTDNEFIRIQNAGKSALFKYKANTRACDWIFFDFDKGLMSSEAIHSQLVERKLNHVILGSKSHLADGITEKFHVLIPTRSPIQSVELFHFVCKHFAKQMEWSADDNCMEISRYLYRHSKLLYIADTLSDLNVSHYEQLKQAGDQKRKRLMDTIQKRKNEKQREASSHDYERNLQLWSLQVMQDGRMNGDGGRYKAGFGHVKRGCARGILLDDVLQVFESINNWGDSWTREEVIRIYNIR